MGFHSGEWRNRQTRWLQVPVFERMWGFKSPLAHGEAPAQQGLLWFLGPAARAGCQLTTPQTPPNVLTPPAAPVADGRQSAHNQAIAPERADAVARQVIDVVRTRMYADGPHP